MEEIVKHVICHCQKYNTNREKLKKNCAIGSFESWTLVFTRERVEIFVLVLNESRSMKIIEFGFLFELWPTLQHGGWR